MWHFHPTLIVPTYSKKREQLCVWTEKGMGQCWGGSWFGVHHSFVSKQSKEDCAVIAPKCDLSNCWFVLEMGVKRLVPPFQTLYMYHMCHMFPIPPHSWLPYSQASCSVQVGAGVSLPHLLWQPTTQMGRWGKDSRMKFDKEAWITLCPSLVCILSLILSKGGE